MNPNIILYHILFIKYLWISKISLVSMRLKSTEKNFTTPFNPVFLVPKLVISGILSSIFITLALYTSFLTTSFFTASLSLLKSTGTGTNLSTFNLSTLLFKFLKLIGTFFSLSISNLPTLDFKLAKSTFLANVDVSTPLAFFKSTFVA